MKKIKTALKHLTFIFTVSGDFKTLLKLLFVFKNLIIQKKNRALKKDDLKYKLKLGETRTIYMRGEDYYILYEIFALESYRLFVENIRDNGTILDLGGHIGLSTIYFRLNKSNPIVVFEPATENYNLLVKNLDGLPDVVIENKAVSDHDGKSIFYTYPDFPSLNSLVSEDNSLISKEKEVEIVSLDTIINNYSEVKYIKFDIEGAEEFVFSASKLVENIPIIFGEIKETKSLSLDKFVKIFDSHSVFVESLNKRVHMILFTKKI